MATSVGKRERMKQLREAMTIKCAASSGYYNCTLAAGHNGPHANMQSAVLDKDCERRIRAEIERLKGA